MLRSLALAVLLLAGCVEEGPPAPLTTLGIRTRLFGHLMEAREADAAPYFIRFGRGDRAVITGETREFARWYADTELGLCLQRHLTPPTCAPLYQLNVAHFRWGNTMLSDLTVRTPGLDHDRDHPFFPPH
jgi:hypothetical protein